MTEPTNQQTLEQRRASNAWHAIEALDKTKDDKKQKEFGSLARSMPSLIRSDGLGQTLAFLLAKAAKDQAKPHFLLYQHVSNWVCDEQDYDYTDDAKWLIKLSTLDYRRATVEALAYIQWLKRFAEAKGWKSEDNGG